MNEPTWQDTPEAKVYSLEVMYGIHDFLVVRLPYEWIRRYRIDAGDRLVMAPQQIIWEA